MLTSATAFDSDVKLYKDTRNRQFSSTYDSVAISPASGTVFASQSGGGLSHVDDRIVASKQRLLQKISEYNNLLRDYLKQSNYNWTNPPEFLSLDSM